MTSTVETEHWSLTTSCLLLLFYINFPFQFRCCIKVGLNQIRTWSTTTVSVHNQYIKRKKWHQHGVKTYTWPVLSGDSGKWGVLWGHSLIRHPHSGKWGAFDSRTPRIAATANWSSEAVVNSIPETDCYVLGGCSIVYSGKKGVSYNAIAESYEDFTVRHYGQATLYVERTGWYR